MTELPLAPSSRGNRVIVPVLRAGYQDLGALRRAAGTEELRRIRGMGRHGLSVVRMMLRVE